MPGSFRELVASKYSCMTRDHCQDGTQVLMANLASVGSSRKSSLGASQYGLPSKQGQIIKQQPFATSYSSQSSPHRPLHLQRGSPTRRVPGTDRGDSGEMVLVDAGGR